MRSAIESLPDISTSSSDSADRLVKVPCRLQVALFYAAFADASSQERQLRHLADHIRRHFSDDWLTPAEIAAPAVQQGARRLAGLLARAIGVVPAATPEGQQGYVLASALAADRTASR